jgi:hypothetical protein
LPLSNYFKKILVYPFTLIQSRTDAVIIVLAFVDETVQIQIVGVTVTVKLSQAIGKVNMIILKLSL